MHVNAYISAIPVQHSCLVNHLHFLQSHFICDILFSFFLLSFLFFWKLFFNPFSKSCFICLSVCLSVESHSKSRFYRTELITISINYVKDIKFSIEQFIISVSVFVYLSCFFITICSTWWCLFYVWLPSANQSINQSIKISLSLIIFSTTTILINNNNDNKNNNNNVNHFYNHYSYNNNNDNDNSFHYHYH